MKKFPITEYGDRDYGLEQGARGLGIMRLWFTQ